MKSNEGLLDAVESMREDATEIERIMCLYPFGDTVSGEHQAIIDEKLKRLSESVFYARYHRHRWDI